MKARKLQLRDIFTMGKILKDIDVNYIIDKYKSIDVKGKPAEEKEKITKIEGLKIIMHIVGNAGNAESNMYQLISDISGEEKNKVKMWELNEFQDFINNFLTENGIEEIKDFFMQAVAATR